MKKSKLDYSRSRAVLVGTSEYRHLEAVPPAMNSLDRMAELLAGRLCDWPADRVSIIKNQLDPGGIPDRLTQLFQDIDQVALFYYVGHGQIAASPSGDTLCLGLVNSRTEPARRKHTSLAFDDVAYAMWHSPAETKVVILDCCYAGLAGRLGRTEVLDLTRATGAYTMAASGEFSTAWYETNLEAPLPQTYFTKYFIDVIENGIPGAGAGLRLESIFRQAAANLIRDRKPEPTSGAAHHAPRFVFAENISHSETPALTIKEKVYQGIIAHARADYPLIACGFVAGRIGSDRAERIIPIRNLANSSTVYEFDPAEMVSAWREMDARDEEPVIAYHSRPDSDTYLSRLDIEYGNSNGLAHFVIVAVDAQGNASFRSHQISETRVLEEEIQIVPAYEPLPLSPRIFKG